MISKFLILALLVVAGSCSRPLLGAQKCTWGPGYWCKGIEQARECGTEEHCRTKVWVGDHPLAKMTKPIPEDDSTLQNGNCAICELVGNEIFNKMKQNATEDEIVAELDMLCEYLPTGTDTCKEFVDEYGKMFWEEFIENASVHDICSYLGFCSQEFLSILKNGRVMSLLISRDVSGIGCDTCQSVMALMQKEISANEKQLEALLDEVCTTLPVDQQECDTTVNSIFETFVSILETYKPEELCQMVGLCSSRMEELMKGVGPVQFGQVGQTGPAQPDDTNKLGTDDSCQNGPAFWCASEENAALCQAEDFCKKNAAPLVF